MKKKFYEKIILKGRTWLLLLLFGFGLLIYASIIEPRQIKIIEREVVTNKWTHKTPLKIAIIADTHAIWPWMTVRHLNRIVEKTNQQNPDLTLLLGDYVATHPFGIQLSPDEGVAPYQKISAPCGVYAVLGNHDLHGSIGWPDALKNTGLPVLENRSIQTSCKGIKFWIAGLEDLWWQNSDIEKALHYVTDDTPIITMMHNPDSFIDIPNKVALSVAGHTHRGQIRFPFIGAIESVIPSKFGKRFHYGHIHENGKDLIVSGGLGTTGLPLRFFAPPEIVIVTLRSENQ